MRTVTKVPFFVPFYTQGVTAETYASEGYETLEEGLSWTARSCGIASLRMAVDGIRGSRGLANCPCQAAVLRRGLERGAYKEGVGWIHQGLAELAAEYAVPAQARRGWAPEELRREIDRGNPCLVSVTPRFEGGLPGGGGASRPRGGHLVTVWGYEAEDGVLTAFLTHHPSCFPESNWPERWVPLERFSASFTGNLVVCFHSQSEF